MISIEDFVELTIRGLEVYVHESEERLIQVARGDKIDGLDRCRCFEETKERKD